MARDARPPGGLGLHRLGRVVVAGLILGLLLYPIAPGAPLASGAPAAAIVPFTAGGDTSTAIQATVDQFRAALGTLNPNTAGSLAGGRREINWDGTPDALSAPNNLPPNFFNTTSPRGVVFTTLGTGFQVSSAPTTNVPQRFGNLNPTYTALFTPFSAPRLFTALGSNAIDVDFFVPGATTPATVSGFGAVFTNVDNPNTTRIQFFNRAGVQIGEVIAPPGQLAFAGGQVDGADGRIARVRITNGNMALGPNNAPPAIDVVVMDDFIYGEPQANTTTTTLGAVPSSVLPGQPVTFMATVTPTATGFGSPTGLVSFQENGVQIGTGTLGGTGQASFVITTLAPGSHTVTAVYAGDGTFGASTSTAVTVVVGAGLTATPTPAPLSVQQAIGQVAASGQPGLPAASQVGQTVQVSGQVSGSGRVTGGMAWTLTAIVPTGVPAGAVPVVVFSTTQGLQGFACAAVAAGVGTVSCAGPTAGNALQGSTVTVVFPGGAIATGSVNGPGAPPPLPPPPPIVLPPPPPPMVPVSAAPSAPAAPGLLEPSGPALPPAQPAATPLPAPPPSGGNGNAGAPGPLPTTVVSPLLPTVVPVPTPPPAATPTTSPVPPAPDDGSSLPSAPPGATEPSSVPASGPDGSVAPTTAPDGSSSLPAADGGEPAPAVPVDQP